MQFKHIFNNFVFGNLKITKDNIQIFISYCIIAIIMSLDIRNTLLLENDILFNKKSLIELLYATVLL